MSTREEHMSNPITESIDYLVECGWDRGQAVNLVAAIRDQSGERLWEVAPKWIEHCAERMKYVHAVLGIAAMGCLEVEMGKDGEWLFSLNDKGMAEGKKLIK
jgi:hypothetical protein